MEYRAKGDDTAFARLDSDGSFVLVRWAGEGGELTRTEFDARGYLSILSIRGHEWTEGSVHVGASDRGSARLLALRRAHSSADGGIDARITANATSGRAIERELRLDSEGRRRWVVADRLPDGGRIDTEASLDSGVTQMTRRRSGPDGDQLWEEESETRFEEGWGRRPGPVATTTGRRTFPDGGSAALGRVSAGTGSRTLEGTSDATFSGRGAGPVAITERSQLTGDGGLATTITQAFADGTTQVTTTTRSAGGVDPSTLTERTVLDVTPDGLGTLRSRGTEQLFVEDDGIQTDSWSSSWTDENGNTVTQEGAWAVDADGNFSQSSITHYPDGTEVLVVHTHDANGNGQETTTITDPNGVETTTAVEVSGADTGGAGAESGPPGSFGGGNGGGNGGGDGGGNGGGNGGGDGGGPLGLDCPDDGDHFFCMEVKLKAEDAESVSRTLPEHVGAVLDGLTDAGPAVDREAVALADRLAGGMRERAAALTSTRRAGARSAAGAGRPLSPRVTARIGGIAPPGGIGEERDLEAYASYVVELATALAGAAELDGRAVNRALFACHGFARAVERAKPRQRTGREYATPRPGPAAG